MTFRRRGWLAVALSCIAAGLTDAGATTANPQTQPGQTTFRTQTDLVVVDFMAIAGDGRPIDDLKKEELTLKVGGKVREIKSFEFVRLAASDAAAPGTKDAAAVASMPALSFGSNLPKEGGRDIYLVFDHESIQLGDERPARDAAARFVDGLGPRDRVALITVPNGTVEVDLTTNRARVREKLATIVGHQPTSLLDEGQEDCLAATNARATVTALTGMFDSLRGQDGPKTVVLISGGTPPAVLSQKGLCSFDLDLTRYLDLGKAASRASVQLYAIQTLEIPTPAAMRGRIGSQERAYNRIENAANGLRDMAGVTGGEVFRLSGTADAVFARIARTSSAHYLLGFEPEPSERNGKTHKISVGVSRPRVDVRARPEFEIPDPVKVRKSAAAAPTQPVAMLRDRAAFRDLPLYATAYAVRTGDRTRLKVVVVAQSSGTTAPLAAAAFGLVDANERMVAQWSADTADLARRPVATATIVDPGPYRLRVSARDAGGRTGAADFDFDARLNTMGSYDVSELLLGAVRADAFVPTFGYTTEPAALAYLELYKTPAAAADPRVTVELAMTPDGPALATVPGENAATPEADRLIVTASLPIADLPRGDYVVRAVVMQGETVVGRILRTLSKGPR